MVLYAAQAALQRTIPHYKVLVEVDVEHYYGCHTCVIDKKNGDNYAIHTCHYHILPLHV